MLFNQNRAHKLMQAAGIDAIVAATPLSITYLTGYTCWIDRLFKAYMTRPGAPADPIHGYALATLNGDITLIVAAMLAANAADCPVDDIRAYGGTGFDGSPSDRPPADRLANVSQALQRLADDSPTATAVLLDALAAKGLTQGSIGIELESLPSHTAQQLAEALPHAELRDCSNLIRLIRMVKTPAEIDRLARATEIGEAAAHAALADARAGASMQDLAHTYRIRLAEQGADLDHFAFCPDGLGIATEPDYHLKPNTTLYLDFGCIYRSYTSDAGLTVCVGPPTDETIRRYRALQTCMAAGAAALVPAAPASAVPAAMQAALAAHGITHCHPHGHGIGLEPRDYPILVPDTHLRIHDDCIDEPADLPLEPNMVVSLEAGLFHPDVGSFQLEQSFTITPTGSEPLTLQDRAEPVTVPDR